MTTLQHSRTPLLLLLVLVTLLYTPAITPHTASAATSEAEPAKVSIVIQAEPSIQVTPGGMVAYTISAKNTGEGYASLVRTWIDYDPALLTIVDTTFERDGDWVSKVAPGYIRLDFNGVGSDSSHAATIHARVAEDAPLGTVINMWAGYEWKDAQRYAQENSSNAAPVLVGDEPLTSAWEWMAVEPFRGEQGTTFSFHSDRFVPGESIKVWLNTLGRIERKKSMDSKADGHGRFWIHYPASELSPGYYQIMVQGERSDLIAGTIFLVKPGYFDGE